MNEKRSVILLRNLLLAFVLVSIGFALGRHSVKPLPAPPPPLPEHGQIRVYYLHSTFRCVTCNTIEQMTKALLERQYGNEFRARTLVFSEVDFQQDEALAKQFDVVASCVVVAAVSNGKVIGFQRLDEVWTQLKDPSAFDRSIVKAIAAMKQKLTAGANP